jgi:CBS domain containing-hemolysin-like protein
VALTAITLFFGELLPKALGVSNAKMVRITALVYNTYIHHYPQVVRTMVPPINVLATLLSPVGSGFSLLSWFLLGV